MKNKKGFTLIELLAVIVVLAIILVIAGTNVIKYINSTKENAKFIAAKEIVNIAEAYMEANNLDVVNIETLINENYLEDDVTNPKTGGNSWSDEEYKQYILRNSDAQEQEDSAIKEDSYYNFNGYTYVTNREFDIYEKFGILTTDLKSNCDDGYVFSKGGCIDRNLADSNTPNEEDESNNIEDSSFVLKACSEYQNIANKLYDASSTHFMNSPLPINISELVENNTAISNLKNPLKESGVWGNSDKVYKNSNAKSGDCQDKESYYRYNYDGYYISIYYK